jgi:ribosomal protein S18 acetylase RimI-like enzyme
MIIRAAVIDDAHAIATIHVRSWQHAYADILPQDGLDNLSIEDRSQQWAGWLQADSGEMNTLVAEIDEEVVGYASWGPSSDDDAEPGTIELYSIYVLPESMNAGIGSALLEAVEVDMIASGSEAATLHVLVKNTLTRKFYERYGWRAEPDSEREESYYGMDMVTIRYRKTFF